MENENVRGHFWKETILVVWPPWGYAIDGSVITHKTLADTMLYTSFQRGKVGSKRSRKQWLPVSIP